MNSFQVVDVNLEPARGTAAGGGGRVMYGTIDPESGSAEPVRQKP